MQLAPDLAVTRERLSPDQVTRWLQDPIAVKPDTTMPRYTLSALEIEALVDFIFNVSIPAEPPQKVPTRLPLLERKVTYPKVVGRVFRKVCWHCHSEPMWFEGIDGGPGNVGGFGYAGKAINFASYDRILAGGKTADGSKIDLFEKVDGVPRLVRHMLARHHEVAGQPVDGVLGMPLGFAPMPIEDIQLVDTWIHQGAPR